MTGQYRFTASVPSVEMNDLRRTLGIKPLPMPVGGALRGILHCTGTLEQPVFSGHTPIYTPHIFQVSVEHGEQSQLQHWL